MYEWQCPDCGGKMYSSWKDYNKKKINCIYCNREFDNKYYEGEHNKLKEV